MNHPHHAAQPARFAVMGSLAEPPHAFASNAGTTWHLQVRIRSHLEGRRSDDVVALLHFPDQGSVAETALACQDKAMRLASGGPVIAVGEGLFQARHHGDAVLQLAHVRAIELAADLGAQP